MCVDIEDVKARTREEVARFIEKQFGKEMPLPPELGKRVDSTHYGMCELRQLMDFIFGCEPANRTEEIFGAGERFLSQIAPEEYLRVRKPSGKAG